MNLGNLEQSVISLYGLTNLKSWFVNFCYFKITGISYKLWNEMGPSWGNHGLSDDNREPKTCTVDQTAWIIPSTMEEATKFATDAAYQDSHNLPPNSYNRFLQHRNVTHRLNYWDKPLHIYVKNPHWTKTVKVTGDKKENFETTANSNLFRTRWHQTDNAFENDIKMKWIGPSFWNKQALDKKNHKI